MEFWPIIIKSCCVHVLWPSKTKDTQSDSTSVAYCMIVYVLVTILRRSSFPAID